jgi:hypothetical protein
MSLGFVIGDCRYHLLAKLFVGISHMLCSPPPPKLWLKVRVRREIRGEKNGGGDIANHPCENLKKAAIRGRREMQVRK